MFDETWPRRGHYAGRPQLWSRQGAERPWPRRWTSILRRLEPMSFKSTIIGACRLCVCVAGALLALTGCSDSKTRSTATEDGGQLPAGSSVATDHGRGPGMYPAILHLGGPMISVSPRSGTTLQHALRRARPGTVIHLASGTYPQIHDSHLRSGWVTVSGAGDATKPVIDGAELRGSEYLRFVSVRFSSSIVLDHGGHAGQARHTEHFGLYNSEIDCGSNGTLHGGARHGNTGIQVRGASQGVTLEGDYIHNCTAGFASIAQDRPSANIAIIHSTIWGVAGDAVDLGSLKNVVIDHDVIGDAHHAGPERLWHNDGIQFYGDDTNVRITNNAIASSGGQLLFIQDAIKSRYTGSSVNRDILVENNLIYGAGAYAVQDQGGEDVRFINNTIWGNHLGSLLLRKSGFTHIAPTDTVVLNNIIEGFGLNHVKPMIDAHNVIDGYVNRKVRAAGRSGDLYDANPHFVNAAAGDFQLAAGSPALRRAADPSTVERYAGAVVPSLILGAKASATSIGAMQPGYPSVAYAGALPSELKYRATPY